jgi:hypothetical protein
MYAFHRESSSDLRRKVTRILCQDSRTNAIKVRTVAFPSISRNFALISRTLQQAILMMKGIVFADVIPCSSEGKPVVAQEHVASIFSVEQ